MTRLIDEGFDQLAQGRPGNGGQNLYVSRGGVLQRIFLTSVCGSGYVDLPIANSHDDNSRNPVTVFDDPWGSSAPALLPTDGAFAGAAADLTGNGYDDIVIANQYDGCSNEVFAQVYYGAEDGWSEKRMTRLWAPCSTDVVAGRFDAGRPLALVFVSRQQLVVFSHDGDGFEAVHGVGLDLGGPVDSVVAADLDGDGCDDLVVRFRSGAVRVYWGGPDGLDAERFTAIPASLTGQDEIVEKVDAAASGAGGGLVVSKPPTVPRLTVAVVEDRPHIFFCPERETRLVSFGSDRDVERVLRVDTGPAFSVTTADLRGSGLTDLVVASRQVAPGDGHKEHSLILWGTPDGWTVAESTMLPTTSANDVAVVWFDERPTVVVCQDMTPEMYSTESLLYRNLAPGADVPEPLRIPTDCALDVLPLRRPGRAPALAFVNHLSNTVRGNIESPIYLGGPDGYGPERTLSLPGWAAVEMKFVDFDDSGRPDVFIANSNENDLDVEHGSFVVRQGEEGFSDAIIEELPTRYAMSGVVGDLDRNGYLDLVVAGFYSSDVLVFRGGPDGFGAPESISLDRDGRTHSEPRFMTLADLDGDGWLDLVVPDCGVEGATIILWGGPDGFDGARRTTLETGPAVSTRVADLDGDGWPDLVVGTYKGPDPGDPYRGHVHVYWGSADGFHASRRTSLPASFPADLTIADFTGDGNLDIFVANYHGHRTRDVDSHIYFGEAGGVFRWENRLPLLHHSACGALGVDLTGNGRADLVVANHKTHGNHVGSSWIWWNSERGFSEERRTDLPSRGTHGITHQDVGDIMRRGPEEWFESRLIDAGELVDVDEVVVVGAVPERTWIRVEVRAGEDAADLAAQPWTAATPPENGDTPDRHLFRVPPGVAGSQVQYRLWLGAWNGVATPRVTRVEVGGAERA